MGGTWKRLDLEGGGLQTLNLRLARALRRRRTAYLLWLLFPLGAHRAYLDDRRGSLGYGALTAAAAVLGLAWGWQAALVPAALLAAAAARDLWWIDRRLVELNKHIRMAAWLGHGAAPPPGWKGRPLDDDPEALLADYVAEKERERAGHAPPSPGPAPSPGRRVPSLAEQERMLRALARARKGAGQRPSSEEGE